MSKRFKKLKKTEKQNKKKAERKGYIFYYRKTGKNAVFLAVQRKQNATWDSDKMSSQIKQ